MFGVELASDDVVFDIRCVMLYIFMHLIEIYL